MEDKLDSDDYPGLNLSQFTEEDFATIDATVASKIPDAEGDRNGTPRNFNLATSVAKESEILDIPTSDAEYALLHEMEERAANSSFQSDIFDLNLNTLTAEDLATLDPPTSEKSRPTIDKPSVKIELEGLEDLSQSTVIAPEPKKPSKLFKRWHDKNPLERFRSYMSLSVTDLVAPAWCEVQYDYGLRGKRSRPVKDRPTSFVSASGKTISPAVTVSKTNEIRTKQGLAVHKQLEREIKFEELKVDITTPETRWALRLVNMIACLRGIMDGFTREMPVFGIIHGEVVVGIMDEVVKVETPVYSNHSPDSKKSKRPSNKPHSNSGAKKARVERPSWQIPIDRFFENPKRLADVDVSLAIGSEPTSTSANRVGYTLHIKDNKTQRSQYLPSEADMYSGRMQLMIYRRLLSELLATNPPYNFKPLWEKLGLDSSEIFPTKFLVQAHLIQDNAELPTLCLDELVDSWHKLIKEYNIRGVDPQLELVYRLRPAPDIKGKGKVVELPETENTGREDEDLARAIAKSLEEISENQVASSGPSDLHAGNLEASLERVDEKATNSPGPTALSSAPPLLDTEDAQMQWALQQSLLPQVASGAELPEAPSLDSATAATAGNGKDAAPSNVKEEQGIRRFEIIGTKFFVHDDLELDNHLARTMKWWRGERKAEGVDIEHSYRCSTCEYIEDCEWRAEKALEHSSSKKKIL